MLVGGDLGIDSPPELRLAFVIVRRQLIGLPCPSSRRWTWTKRVGYHSPELRSMPSEGSTFWSPKGGCDAMMQVPSERFRPRVCSDRAKINKSV